MKTRDFYLLLIRLFLGYVFASSGLCKLCDGQFAQLIGPPHLIRDLAKYDLGLFAHFIAYGQVIVGFLVMSQRFSLLGLVMLLPINLSILMVTTSQHWQGTPYVNAFLSLLNILALLGEWKSLRFFILPEAAVQIPPQVNALFPQSKWAFAGLVLGISAAIIAPFWPWVVTYPGALAFVLMYLNVFQYPGFRGLEKWILGLSLGCVVGIGFAWVWGMIWLVLGMGGLILGLLGWRGLRIWFS
jgi:uncharacterized membrane protein YphA (DoxX/SURF4 family)